ncbi:hypothetical protein [Streptodolium elevatio]|uniref:Secreted protein n=1 Tax=Streptodolium elevatio TaxID=3157996 RepID=A0ABV3DE42_9ACTN
MKNLKRAAVAMIGAGLALGLAAVGAVHVSTAEPDPKPYSVASGEGVLPGDDNNDGRVDEDETGWDCRTMGNRECGVWVLVGVEYQPDEAVRVFSTEAQARAMPERLAVDCGGHVTEAPGRHDRAGMTAVLTVTCPEVAYGWELFSAPLGG